jgi:radical SAM superfamily enzyme YgiQ (UPF0313 family)
MKILLINPPNTHIVKSGVSSFIDSFVKENPMPPLGLMYLASFVERATEHEIRICDMNVGDPLLAILMRYKPQVIGITTTTLTLYDALQVAKTVKEVNRDIITIMGGPHCGIYPQETASFSEIDYVIQGEGELPFLRVLNGIPSKIADVEIVEDLDTLPMPARHLIDIHKYHSVLNKKPVTSILTSRGCPYQCQFCYQPHYGKRWRARSAENVVEEMAQIAKMGIGEIEIMDDTFTFNRDRVMEICDILIHYGANRIWSVDWDIRTRVDKVDLEMLQKMKLAGCKRINYGIESFNRETLKTLRKGFETYQIFEAIRWTKEVGIETQAYLMLGSPNETFPQMKHTIYCTNQTNPDYAYYSLTSPMPGTAMYEQGLKEERYLDYWREFALNPSPDFKMKIWREDIRNEMIQIMEQGYKSFYFRPSYVMRQIIRVKSFNELVRKSKMAVEMAIK